MNHDERLDLLLRYLDSQREAVLWKAEGVGERDLRYPRTASGTNLLGVVKHLATVEAGYFGECLGAPMPFEMPWYESFENDDDMWATASESPESILRLYRDVTELANTNIRRLGLDAVAQVPWWSPSETHLERLLVHMIAETARHAGHMDILREGIDGAAGQRREHDGMAIEDADCRSAHVERLREIADATAQP